MTREDRSSFLYAEKEIVFKYAVVKDFQLAQECV